MTTLSRCSSKRTLLTLTVVRDVALAALAAFALVAGITMETEVRVVDMDMCTVCLIGTSSLQQKMRPGPIVEHQGYLDILQRRTHVQYRWVGRAVLRQEE